MTYPETLEYIYRLARFGMKPGLERISALLGNLGNPEKEVKVVHVTGTNGKGSTATFLSSILAAGGYRVGLFTSPHLIRFTERIRINGAEIDEVTVVRLAERVMEAAPPDATFFEIVTAMAFLHFAEERVDLAVVEAGMGGRMDATNAAAGILTLITPISLDHCRYLGETVADIAWEKAGLIRPGRPVVVSARDGQALSVIKGCCSEVDSPLYVVGVDFGASWEPEGLAYRGPHTRLAGLKPGIPGRYQAENAATALCAAELLADAGFMLDGPALRTGVESAHWPGRMELIGDAPRFLLDGAHNGAGAEALAEAVSDIPHERLYLVAGVMGDKDAEGILAPLLHLVTRVYAVSPELDRALPSDELASLCRGRGVDAGDAGGVVSGLSLAGSAAGPGDLVLVCGSLFTVGEARAFLLAQHFEPCRG